MLLENCTYPADTRVRNEAETLAGEGYHVTVLAPRGDDEPKQECIRGVSVRRYRVLWATGSAWSYAAEYAIAHVQLLLRALPLLVRREVDVLHFHGPPDTLFVVGICARLFGCRVVYDLHDSGPELVAAKFGNSPVRRLMAIAQELAIVAANRVIVTNESQHQIVRARAAGERTPVSIVRNGPRPSEFPDPVIPTPGRLQRPLLVYVGALDVQDGVLDIPELLVHPTLSKAVLTVVGEGPAKAELQQRCRRLGISERVRLLGRVAHERVAELIGAADIAIDPAPCNELNHGSTMIKIAEYMAAGRPTVAYALRETQRTAQDAALYAPCGDRDGFVRQIGDLIEDGERRLALGRLARERSLGLSWDQSARALLQTYRRLDQ